MARGALRFSLLLMLVVLMEGCANAGGQHAGMSAATGHADASATSAGVPNQFETIHNDFYWVDQNGARILTRSGCLRQFNGIFYWYGGNPRGFREQYCYTSTDLVHWTNQGVVLRNDPDANRIDVLFNDTTKQYVMFLKYDGNGAYLGIATAQKPEGPFTFKSKTLIDNARIGDMSIFEDDDGTAYLCYVSWAIGTNAQHGIYRMSKDYLTPDKRMYLWNIGGREAPHMFKRNGTYWYGTSKTAGIQSSGTSYYTATNLEGPWSPAQPLSTPGSKNSWDSQVDFVYPIKGTQGALYMFAGDRWVKDAPQGRNGDYVWLPMEWDGDTPMVNYDQDWELNLSTGTWRKFDPSRDLAAGKAATASSEEGDNVAKHVTDATTFQNYAQTHWDSAASDPQWIQIDLGAATQLNRVILKWNLNAAQEFKIQTSLNGTDWIDVFSTAKGSSFSVTDESFPTISARYVRMYGTKRATPPANFRRRFRGAPGSTAQPATEAATLPATQPARPLRYSLFQFMVLKD
jgi:hypothetical protein